MPEIKSTSQIALYIDPTKLEVSGYQGQSFGVFTLSFVEMREDGSLEYLHTYSSLERQFRPIRFRGQWENQKPELCVYGQTCSLVDIDIEHSYQVKDLATIMRKIDKAKQSMPNESLSFGEFVAHICKALKIKTVVYRTRHRSFSPDWRSLNDNQHEKFSIDSAALVIDTMIEETHSEINGINKRLA